MPTNQPLIDDLLTLGGSLINNIADMRHEWKAQAKNGVESVARKLDLVSREEFDAAFAMLSKARLMQEDLAERLAKIEAHLHLSSAPKSKKTPKKTLPSLNQGKSRKRQK
jgi:BMFP domain-containing protein YqiC